MDERDLRNATLEDLAKEVLDSTITAEENEQLAGMMNEMLEKPSFTVRERNQIIKIIMQAKKRATGKNM